MFKVQKKHLSEETWSERKRERYRGTGRVREMVFSFATTKMDLHFKSFVL